MQLGPTIISDASRRQVKHDKVTQKATEKSTPGAQKGPVKTVPNLQMSKSLDTTATIQDSEERSVLDSESSNSDSSVSEGNKAMDNVQENKIAKEQAKTKPSKCPLLRPPKSLETTMFDRLETMYGGRIKRMLDVQYRCGPLSLGVVYLLIPHYLI